MNIYTFGCYLLISLLSFSQIRSIQKRKDQYGKTAYFFIGIYSLVVLAIIVCGIVFKVGFLFNVILPIAASYVYVFVIRPMFEKNEKE